MKQFNLCFKFAVFFIFLSLCRYSAWAQYSVTWNNEEPGTQDQAGNLTNINASSTNHTVTPESVFSAIPQSFGVAEATFRQALTDIYGTLMGRPECIAKAVCYLGYFFRTLPARDLIFFVVNKFVPQEWVALFGVFQASAANGQDCTAYICTSVTTPR